MRDLVRVQTGLRVDRHLLPSFKQLCQAEGFGIGEAVEGFMEAAVQARSVKVALDGAERLSEAQKLTDMVFVKARISDLESLMEAGRTEMKNSGPLNRVWREEAVKEAVETVLRVLPRIEDLQAQKEIPRVVQRAAEYIAEERRHNAAKSVLFR